MKKFTSLLLTLAMLLSLMPMSVMAEKSDVFSDVESTDYYAEAAEALAEKAILTGYPDGTFGAEKSITRAEMAAVICRTIDMEAEAKEVGGETDFDDVEDNHWASGYINVASEEGIINGDGNGLFRPEDDVKYEEAVKMVVCALGMDENLESDPNDWSAGYIKAAKDNGITDDLKGSKGKAASRGDIAVMIYNGIGTEDTSAPAGAPEKPEASVKSGSYTSRQTVKLTTETEGAKIYYTTDGSEPTVKSTEYTKAITIGTSLTLKAIAAVGDEVSDVMSEKYVVNLAFDSSGGGGRSSNSGSDDDGGDDAENYRVTFVLNDGSEGAYEMQVVPAEGKATKPEDPEREMYAFDAWYTEAETINEYDFSTQVKNDLVLYAGWTSPEGDDALYSASSGGGTVYSITGIEVKNDKVNTTINVDDTAVLYVEFLDEESEEVIGSVSAQTPNYCELTAVSIPLDVTLPEYYIVVAYLLDSESNELCNPYKCIKYTSNYEKFEKQSIEDFEDDRVLNFDNSKTDNYGVFTEDVKRIESNDSTNTLVVSNSPIILENNHKLEEGLTVYYIFSNVNEQVLNLAIGDDIYIEDTEYLLKIKEITKNEDGTVTIVSDENVELTDFYDVLDVNLTVDIDDAEKVEENNPELMVEIIDASGSWGGSLGGSLEKEINDNLSIEGSLKGTGTVEIEMLYDAKFFSDDYFSCSITSSLDLDLEISVKAKIDNDDEVNAEIKLARVHIPTPVAGLTVYYDTTVPTEWEISGGGTFNFNYNVESGFHYDTDSGSQTVDKKDYSVKLNLEGEAKLTFGPKVALGIAYLDKIVNAEVNVQAGVEVSASTEIGAEITNADSKHACTLCLEGEAKWFVKVKAKLKFEINKKLKWTPIDAELVGFEGWINFLNTRPGKFYFSLINGSDSRFGGRPHFGGGECPNNSYRITIRLKDSDNNEISGNRVTIKKPNGTQVASGDSAYTTYLYNGTYNVSSKIDNSSVSKQFVVSDDALEIVLNANSTDGEISGKIIDAVTNGGVANATVLISKDSIIVATLTSQSDGSYSIKLPEGTYTVKITKDNYVPFSSVIFVSEGNTTYLPTTLLVSESEQTMGGFSGKIVDATTGRAVEGVTLKLRESWNNTSEGSVIKTLTTDSNGDFEYKIITIYGIVFGLPAGGYTLTATKEGYATNSYNITVLPGVVNPNQGGNISPELSDGEYRIKLSWVNSPYDLDAHLTGPTESGSRFHLYFPQANENGGHIDMDKYQLDIDNTNIVSEPNNPETVTILKQMDGTYRYSIHDYTNRENESSMALANSQAFVEVIKGNTIIKTFPVPTNKAGTIWTVFELNGDTITPINRISNGEFSDIRFFSVDENEEMTYDENLIYSSLVEK